MAASGGAAMAITQLIVTAAATTASIMASEEAAEEQRSIAEAQDKAEAEARDRDAILKYQQLEENRRQKSLEDSKESQEIMETARRERAAQRTATAESGLAGIGKLSIEQALGMQEIMDLSSIKKRGENADTTYRLQGRAVRSSGTTLPSYYGSTGMGTGMAALTIGLAGAGSAMSSYRGSVSKGKGV